MGYYTNFELSVDHEEEAVREFLASDAGNLTGSYLSSWLNYYAGFWSAEGKWYEHSKDMKMLSAAFPDILFTLTGDGEEKGDLWVKYYKNGKEQIANAHITYEEFDETKLL